MRSFLLYYGIPVPYGILPDNYFHHYAIFVHAIYICLKESISSEDFKKAELMIFSFCEDFSSLYGKRFITLNVHQLLHLTDDVRDLGPIKWFKKSGGARIIFELWSLPKAVD